MQRIVGYIRNRRGQSVVELGLALPIVLMLVMGIFDFGLLMYKTTLTNEAARAGARMAVVTTDNTAVEQAIDNAAPLNFEVPPTLTLPPETRKTGDEVKVAIDGKYRMIFPIFNSMFTTDSNGYVTIHGEATMRME